MKLHTLPKTTITKKKRVGRGAGSGKGFHTAGRGQKGQKSRSSVSLWFEGGQLPLSRRLPFLRGKDRFKMVNDAPITINIAQLSQLKTNTVVDKKLLLEMGLISPKEAARQSVKLLAAGEIAVALHIIGLTASQAAKQKIEKAGGKFTDN